jgi:hypothetical protein
MSAPNPDRQAWEREWTALRNTRDIALRNLAAEYRVKAGRRPAAEKDVAPAAAHRRSASARRLWPLAPPPRRVGSRHARAPRGGALSTAPRRAQADRGEEDRIAGSRPKTMPDLPPPTVPSRSARPAPTRHCAARPVSMTWMPRRSQRGCADDQPPVTRRCRHRPDQYRTPWAAASLPGALFVSCA